MRRIPARRYVVRGPDGTELACPSLDDLHKLYVQGFLADDDLVKQEGAGEWTAVGRFPALHGLRQARREPRRMALLLAATLALALAAAMLLRR